MKRLYRYLLPVMVIGVCVLAFVLNAKGILPYEMIPGVPFDLSIVPMMVMFWLAYFVLDRNVFQPLYGVMESREKAIAEADARLENAEEKVNKTVEERETQIRTLRESLRVKRDEVRARLSDERAVVLKKAREDADARLEEALGKIESERNKAQKDLEAFARQLAVTLAERILGRKVA
ncbi:MAG TPA: ATP synthase F0 subunit B [Thermoanaerobaculia bacterium]|nr:ATP synthase F0 subunit B [Thermoanaerobaculia bacterium]HUM28910.1 ATP synthase F0 subunit B [Thermoanaerobaculia bacterium]HXK67157.1 ATP synthase F0 subunit B [Thermoanaerobaculia bacterium]